MPDQPIDKKGERPEAAIRRLAEGAPIHYFDCDRYEVYDHGLRRGKCDCTATLDLTALVAEVERLRAGVLAVLELHPRVPVYISMGGAAANVPFTEDQEPSYFECARCHVPDSETCPTRDALGDLAS